MHDVCVVKYVSIWIHQMEHETMSSDLDSTRKRAQVLESEKEHLRAELLRQQKEVQRSYEQVCFTLPEPLDWGRTAGRAQAPAFERVHYKTHPPSARRLNRD